MKHYLGDRSLGGSCGHDHAICASLVTLALCLGLFLVRPGLVPDANNFGLPQQDPRRGVR